MNWINLLRIIIPGIILGLILGKIIVKKPKYVSSLNPKRWLNKGKKLSGKNWTKLIIFSIIFGISSHIIIANTQALLEPLIGEMIVPDENIFQEIIAFSPIIFFATIIILPIFEEWIFRGVLLEEFLDKYNSKKLAVLLSAIIFALFHLSNPGTTLLSLIVYLIGGLILGVTYIIGGLKLSTLTHIFYNISPFVISLIILL